MKDALSKFLDRVLSRVTVSDPSRESLAVPYSSGKPLSPNNVVQALGAPRIEFPGATGYATGPSTQTLEKRTIVYKNATAPGYQKVGGGFTYSGFDAPPSGGIFNAGQS